MKYIFVCPLDGCSEEMEVDAESEDVAKTKLTEMAKNHLETVHPEVKKTDEQVSEDIGSLMKLKE